jgi:hypothetical protein
MEKPDLKYFREYRKTLGFTSQGEIKKFFGAKDIKPGVDYTYIDSLNLRLEEIVKKFHSAVNDKIKTPDLNSFLEENIKAKYKKMLGLA